MRDRHACETGRAPIVVPQPQRRALLKGLATLPLAAVLSYPVLARAQARGLQTVEIEDVVPVRGVVALPDADSAPAILLIHEWWGLNEQVKAVAAAFAKLGYVALAVDLFDSESVTTPDGAMELVQSLDPEAAEARLVAAVDWLAIHEKANGKVAILGWGFGAGWALNTALATPVDATVIYYGNVDKTASELQSLSGPVLGHFATHDQFITKDMVERFAREMKEAGKSPFLTTYWYDADHAFANPAGDQYDADDAKLAWDRTLEFLRAGLS